MADDENNLFAWRGLPKRHRCDKCQRGAVVVFEVSWLCGECFFEESVRRLRPIDYAGASSSTTRSEPVRLRCS